MLKTVVGMFFDIADARRAVYDLEGAGFPEGAISVAMRERYDSGFGSGASLLDNVIMPNTATTTPMDYGKTRLPGLEPATVTDAPGFGPIIAAGPLAGGLGGAALGQAAGGLTGALSDVGIPNEVARELIDRVRTGEQTLVCIRVERAECDRVEALMVENHADEVYRSADRAANYSEGRRATKAAEMGF